MAKQKKFISKNVGVVDEDLRVREASDVRWFYLDLSLKYIFMPIFFVCAAVACYIMVAG